MIGIVIFFNVCFFFDIWRYYKIRNIWGNFGLIKEIKLVVEFCFFGGGCLFFFMFYYGNF